MKLKELLPLISGYYEIFDYCGARYCVFTKDTKTSQFNESIVMEIKAEEGFHGPITEIYIQR